MHGQARAPTWSYLESTASVGAKTITVNETVDWQVGETIVIASTRFDMLDSEVRVIASVTASYSVVNSTQNNSTVNVTTTVITFTDPLLHQHYASVDSYGISGETVEIRAEVGLLTRNFVFRGNPITSPSNETGAHILVHSINNDDSYAKISYIEFVDVGQQ